MKNYIVITSIFHPTEAVREFSRRPGYKLLVIGDAKSPADWVSEGVEFVDLEQQSRLPYRLVEHLPRNHYCRKMIGYLNAIKQGADVIIDTDDDNIPKADWSFPGFEGRFESLTGNLGFVNIYQLFTDLPIWPRGFPLNLISRKFSLDKEVTETVSRVGVWQGLADEDPDVDAIYRLTDNQPCYFKKRSPIVLGRGTISPFNSQNTAIRRELFPLLYLPTFVTFRFTDILRGLVAQPIMWAAGYHLGFVDATVVQKRNPHDYMKDFQSELPMYLHCEKVIDVVGEKISSAQGVADNLYEAYRALLHAGIVEKSEMTTLSSWLADILS